MTEKYMYSKQNFRRIQYIQLCSKSSCTEFVEVFSYLVAETKDRETSQKCTVSVKFVINAVKRNVEVNFKLSLN
jgi:hypothetical protein